MESSSGWLVRSGLTESKSLKEDSGVLKVFWKKGIENGVAGKKRKGKVDHHSQRIRDVQTGWSSCSVVPRGHVLWPVLGVVETILYGTRTDTLHP